MTIARITLTVLALLLAAFGWRHRDALGAFLSPPPAEAPRPAKIEFDNGTVRQVAPPASATAAKPPPPGGVRKCRKPGGELVYTDGNCPPGSKEQALAGGAVNVVSSTEAGFKPARPPADAPGAPGLPGAAGGRPLGPELREKMVERAVHGTP